MAADVLSRLGLVGLSHHTAPAPLRDRIAAEEAMAVVWADRFAGLAEETLVLVTCDRVDAFVVAADPAPLLERMADDFAAAGGLDRLGAHGYRRLAGDAVRHLYRVGASLDSMVVGEPQVLGQLKEADRRARQIGRIGPVLDLALSGAYAAAKRVRSETAVGQRPVSIAAAAGHVARDIHGDLSGLVVLVVGTAEMGELLVDALTAAGLGRRAVADTGGPRPAAQARRLDATLVPFDRPASVVSACDVLVCATSGGAGPAIPAAVVAEAMRLRRRRPLFLVDAAMPAGIDPAAQALDGVFLYSLADLERLAIDGRAMRAGAASAAEAIVEEELARLAERIGARDAAPAIRDLADRFERERRRALADGGGDAERATALLVARLMHGPMAELRRLAAEDPAQRAAAERLLARMFEATKEEGGS
ncbi:glutamyl-tRNA reductase [Stella humosa]|uniref:Glutamyl-tRNA reductase n=1 Tax=Stella humosa TaxID=94 RepID=A0A3N1MBH9_9PROT|nr:glutamyl-tRNA reductase [Stella humosa]ROQ00057.1 glutamyl-tRNA reductase [Stella humosa]BBK30710.1 glutamyl-tRNA reductase [Stella humosa]